MSEWIPPEHREIHDWLTQWGRWLRSSIPQGHCGSIEHLWRSPQCWYPPEPRPEPPEERKALLIEKVMRIVQKRPRRLLKFKYVYKADRLWISNRLRFHTLKYEEELYTARQVLKRLTFPETKPMMLVSNHNPVSPAHAEIGSDGGPVTS